jgi:hypothetical protein
MCLWFLNHRKDFVSGFTSFSPPKYFYREKLNPLKTGLCRLSNYYLIWRIIPWRICQDNYFVLAIF